VNLFITKNLLSAKQSASFKLRALASLLHLGLSGIVALCSFALVYYIWFPNEYWELAGGRGLFILVVSVDVIVGPLLTLAIFNPGKGMAKLKFDLICISIVQILALLYGMYTVALVRPIYTVFTVDRFEIVTPADISDAAWQGAKGTAFEKPTWFGPKYVVAITPTNQQEAQKIMFDALSGGADLHQLPKYYKDYANAREQVIKHAKPINILLKRATASQVTLLTNTIDHIEKAAQLSYVPIKTRQGFGIALLDSNYLVIKLLPIDPT
jgi:hypothetical protein